MAAMRPVGQNVALFNGKSNEEIRQALTVVKAELGKAHAVVMDSIVQIQPLLEDVGKLEDEVKEADRLQPEEVLTEIQQLVPRYQAFYATLEGQLTAQIAKEQLEGDRAGCAKLVTEAEKVKGFAGKIGEFARQLPQDLVKLQSHYPKREN